MDKPTFFYQSTVISSYLLFLRYTCFFLTLSINHTLIMDCMKYLLP